MAIFLKDERHAAEFPKRILHSFTDFTNGVVHGSDDLLKPTQFPEDQRKLRFVTNVLQNKLRVS